MKKSLRFFLAFLLLEVLMLPLNGVSCRAEDGSPLFTGDETLVYALYTTGDEGELTLIPGDMEGTLLDGQSCSVYYGETELFRAGGSFQLKALSAKEDLTVDPPPGYCVSQLYLYGDEISGEPVDLLSQAVADPLSAKISLPGQLFFDENGSIDAALFSSLAEEKSGYTLFVLIEKIPADVPVTAVYVTGGETDDSPEELIFAGEALPTASPGEELLARARGAGMLFTGWKLTYSNGAGVLIEAGELLLPYEPVILEAQWKNCPSFTISVTSGTLPYGTSPEELLSVKAEYAEGLEPDFSHAEYFFTAETGESPEYPLTCHLPVGQYTLSVSSGVAVLKDGIPLTEEEYQIEYVPGLVSVTPRAIALAAKAPVPEGDAYVSAGYTLSGALAEGDTLIRVELSAPVLNGTLVVCMPTGALIENEAGQDVTENYEISYLSGQAEVSLVEPSPAPSSEPEPTPGSEPEEEKVPLLVTADSGVWVYDGTAHTVDGYTVEGLEDGDTVSAVSFEPGTDSITEAGEQEARIASITLVDSESRSANGKYDITFIPGKLEVTKAHLTLTAESAGKIYDGKPLENRNVSATKLANEKHTLSVRLEVSDKDGNVTKAVEVGAYTKRITAVVIKDGERDVSGNYDILLIDGTLTVDPAEGSSLISGNTSANAGSPLTGDEANLSLWATLLAASAFVLIAVVAVCLLCKKRNTGK